MNFSQLQERLRLELLRRIDRGVLTGTMLARQTGFRQAHISNFLHSKRMLSLEGLDRVLAAQMLSLRDLIPQERSSSKLGQGEPSELDLADHVPLVSHATAMFEPHISEQAVIETVPVPRGILRHLRSRRAVNRREWLRFVAVRANVQQASAMEPLLLPESIVVLDRHYNSLARYRNQQPSVYGVRAGGVLLLRYAEFDMNRLILRPLSRHQPVQLLALGSQEMPSDLLVGRVCLIISQL